MTDKRFKVIWFTEGKRSFAGLALKDAADTYVPKGGTGFGVRLLLELLRRWQD